MGSQSTLFVLYYLVIFVKPLANVVGNHTCSDRKPKKDIVQKWQLENPEGTKYQCVKDTGLSKNTVKKWWNNQ